MDRLLHFLLLPVLLMVACLPNCRADITVKTYLKDKKIAGGSTMDGIYLNGVGQGLSWANFWLKTRGLPRMYCQPDSLPLSGGAYLQMVDRQIEFLRPLVPKSQLEETTLPFLLQKALIESFPCPETGTPK
jgi:hypothetical protein